MKPIRVLVVDDNADFLKGAATWLSVEPRIEVVATASSGDEAIALVERRDPELVLMDVAMPGMNGFETTRRIKAREGSPHVLLLTFHESETARINAKQAMKDKGEITITTYSEDEKVYIKFTDNGVGIEEENLRKIFDPGFTTKGVGVGTGLGLSICYQIIQDHKGCS